MYYYNIANESKFLHIYWFDLQFVILSKVTADLDMLPSQEIDA